MVRRGPRCHMLTRSIRCLIRACFLPSFLHPISHWFTPFEILPVTSPADYWSHPLINVASLVSLAVSMATAPQSRSAADFRLPKQLVCICHLESAWICTSSKIILDYADHIVFIIHCHGNVLPVFVDLACFSVYYAKITCIQYMWCSHKLIFLSDCRVYIEYI